MSPQLQLTATPHSDTVTDTAAGPSVRGLPERTNVSPRRPSLPTGEQVRTQPVAPAIIHGYRPLILTAVVPESDDVTSYWLETPDSIALPAPVAGQFLPIAVDVPGHGVLQRSYTISAFEDGRYRLSVKRECRTGRPPGRVSTYIHDHWTTGDRISARHPAGGFVLGTTSQRPTMLLGGGIGITPLLAMLRDLARRAPHRHTVLIWAVRHHGVHPFRRELAELLRRMPNLAIHVRYSKPRKSAIEDPAPDSVGYVDEALLRRLVPAPDADIYLCGPPQFMAAMRRSLQAIGVPDERVRSEAFGPANLDHRRAQAKEAASGTESIVTFERSNTSAPFDPNALNLLEFAEDLGLSPAFNCRSGTCGACAVRRVSGVIRYEQEPTAVVPENEVLLCCARPAGPVSLDL